MGAAIILTRLLETAVLERLGPEFSDIFQVSRSILISLVMASLIAWLAVNYRRQYERQLQARNTELEATRDFLSGIIRDSAEGIVTLDVRDRITSWNRAAQRIFGWEAREVVGQSVEMFLPDDELVIEERKRVAERIRAGEVVLDHLTTRVRKDGKPIAVRVSWSPLRNAAGQIVGMTGIVLDITAEREMSERLVEQERLAAVGEMAAHVAHEIRNPLAGIRGACEVLFTKGEGSTREIGDEVLHQIDRLNQTVTELLQFSNPRALETVSTDLNAVIDLVVSVFKGDPASQSVRIERRYAPDLPQVEIDPRQIEQVLYNLFLNAAQAMAHDGTIRVTTGCGEGHVKILVHDSGPGLPDAVSGEVFKPFYTTRTEGTGLGLSIVKKVVEAHGGTVEATNPEEGGAEFRIRLPLKPSIA